LWGSGGREWGGEGNAWFGLFVGGGCVGGEGEVRVGDWVFRLVVSVGVMFGVCFGVAGVGSGVR